MQELAGLVVLVAVAGGLLVLLLTVVLVREARRPPRRTAAYAIARGLPVDPGDLGLAFESWWLDRPGGIRLPVWEIDGHGGSPLTAVFVHGWGQSRIDVLARLGSWRHRCRRQVLYDLRGHGDSETRLSDLGHDEDADLRALLDRLGGGPFLLVGFSMGAAIALATASADRSERIAGVVAYGPYRDFHTALQGRLRRGGYPTRPLTDLAMLWFRARGLRHPDAVEHAATLTCPLLVVHGEADEVSPLADATSLVDAATEATLVTVANAGHLDAHEVAAAVHEDAIDAFLARLRPPPQPSPAARGRETEETARGAGEGE